MCRLGSKLETDLKNRPILVKFADLPFKLKLIKNALHLKITSYSISIDRTIEECSSYKALLNQKNELEKEEMSGNRSSKSETLLGIKNL